MGISELLQSLYTTLEFPRVGTGAERLRKIRLADRKCCRLTCSYGRDRSVREWWLVCQSRYTADAIKIGWEHVR